MHCQPGAAKARAGVAHDGRGRPSSPRCSSAAAAAAESAVEAIVPVDVVVAVHADLVPGAASARRWLRKRARDLRPRQQRAVEQRAPAVHARHVGAQHLGEEAGLEQPADGAAGVIRPAGDEEAGAQPAPLERARQRRDAVAQADVGVDVDLERDAGQSDSVHDVRRSERVAAVSRPRRAPRPLPAFAEPLDRAPQPVAQRRLGASRRAPAASSSRRARGGRCPRSCRRRPSPAARTRCGCASR